MKNIKLNLLSFITLIIGIIVTIMIFLPALAFSDSNSSFLGYEVMFGTEFVNLGSYVSGEIVWSPLAIIAYIMPLAAGLVAVLTKKGIFISLLLFTLSAVLLFALPSYTKTTITIGNTVTEIDIDWTISYGLIIAAVFAVLGSIVCLYKVVYKKI